MIWVYLILLLVSSIIWIVFLTKFWRMCNDVRDIKRHLTEVKHTPKDEAPSENKCPFKGGDSVIYPPTRKVLIVSDLYEDGSVGCYAPEGEFSGVFDAAELKPADN